MSCIRFLPAACLAALLPCACAGAAATGPATARALAVLPFRPVAASPEEVVLAQDSVHRALGAQPGVSFVQPARIEEALAARRVRVIETLDAETAAWLSQALEHPVLLTSSLLYTRERPQPTAALLVRVFDEEGRRKGSLLWAQEASDSADIFGLGAPEDLRALLEVAAGSLAPQILELVRRPEAAAGPRIAVLPFQSAGGSPESGGLAALIAAHVLEEEFRASVVEPGDLYAGFRRARIRNLGLLGTEAAGRLAQEVGARWFLTGTILELDYGNDFNAPPRVALNLRLYDAEHGRTAASLAVFRSGDQGETILQQGLSFHPIENLRIALEQGIQDLRKHWERS